MSIQCSATPRCADRIWNPCRLTEFSIACVIAIAMALPTNSQTLSPLQQVMTSLPIIAWPAVFREMQAKLGSELKNVKPGLQVDALFAKFNELETMIQKPLTGNKVEYNASTHMITLWLPHLRADSIIQFNYEQPTKLIFIVSHAVDSTLKARLYTFLKPVIVSGLGRLPESVRKSLGTAAIEYLKTHGVDSLSAYPSAIGDLNQLADSLARVLSQYVIDRIKDNLLNVIRDKLPGIFTPVPDSLHRPTKSAEEGANLAAQLANTDSAKASVGSAFTQKLDGDTVAASISAAIARVQQLLGHTLGQAEELVQGAVKAGARFFAAGNVGLAVSDATAGALSGGVIVSGLIGSEWRFAGYANQSYVTNDASPGSALYGFQAQYANGDHFQFDLLIGMYGNTNSAYGSDKFLSLDNKEIALGPTVKVNDIILTLAFTKIVNSARDCALSVSAQYPPISTSVITVGWAYDRLHAAGKPVFKISAPILP